MSKVLGREGFVDEGQMKLEQSLIERFENNPRMDQMEEDEQFNYGTEFGGKVVAYWNDTRYGYYVMVRLNGFFFLVRIKSELLSCNYCPFWPQYKNIIGTTQYIKIEQMHFVERPRCIYGNNRVYLCLALGINIALPTKFYFWTKTQLFEHTINATQFFHPHAL